MDWDKESVERLEVLFMEKWTSMKNDLKTDRKNLSCHWNRYLKQYEVRVLRFGERKPNEPRSPYLSASQRFQGIIDLINFKNDEVANGLVIDNPDRVGQHMLIQREVAERILVLGMI
jgi:hypothetical protein